MVPPGVSYTPLDFIPTAVGMKSRGVYETPGGTILLEGHRAIESLTLDGPSTTLKDEIMPKYAQLIYDGLWFSPEREMLQACNISLSGLNHKPSYIN